MLLKSLNKNNYIVWYHWHVVNVFIHQKEKEKEKKKENWFNSRIRAFTSVNAKFSSILQEKT